MSVTVYSSPISMAVSEKKLFPVTSFLMTSLAQASNESNPRSVLLIVLMILSEVTAIRRG